MCGIKRLLSSELQNEANLPTRPTEAESVSWLRVEWSMDRGDMGEGSEL